MQRALLTAVLAALALCSPASAGGSTVALAPSADLGFPFLCDWGYDWESRCFREDGDRLPLGGAGDKAWRSGLRFSLAGIPSGAAVVSARLRVRYDGICVAPLRGSAPCVAPGAVIDAHRILSAKWLGEREPELDLRVFDTAVVFEPSEPQWLEWDLSSLVQAWHAGLLPNNGLLLKLQEGDESRETPGPLVPSSTFAEPGLRPVLVVSFALPVPR